MRCTQCAAVTFSAAARTLVERGDRCEACGGEVVLVTEHPPVGVAAEAPAGEPDARRFERD